MKKIEGNLQKKKGPWHAGKNREQEEKQSKLDLLVFAAKQNLLLN